MTKKNKAINQLNAAQVNVEPINNETVPENQAQDTTIPVPGTPKEAKKTVKPSSSKSEVSLKKYGPNVKAKQEAEIKRMSSNSKYHLTPIPNTSNAIINITEAYKAGIDFYRKKDNRIHGLDLERTGESLMNYGAQLPLSIIPVREAEEAGVEFERFKTDPNKDKPCSKNGFMVIEGHGRMEFLLKQNTADWPVVLGMLPAPDKDGEIHIENGFIELNRNDSVWGSKDYVLIRLSDSSSHEGWRFIKELEDNGLGFTVASIFATGRENAITKKTVLNSSEDEVKTLFEDLTYGKDIYAAAAKTFTTDKKSALMTKAIPNKIFEIWSSLLKHKEVDAKDATQYMVKFLKDLEDGSKAANINAAQKDGDKDRDTVRKELFSKYFNEYQKKNPIV